MIKRQAKRIRPKPKQLLEKKQNRLMAERPKFYVTPEYTAYKGKIWGSILEAYKENTVTKKPDIKNIEKGIKILEKHQTQIAAGNYGISREAKIDLLDYCNKWIKEYKNYIKRNKKE